MIILLISGRVHKSPALGEAQGRAVINSSLESVNNKYKGFVKKSGLYRKYETPLVCEQEI
jgi:hypothetical protein